MITATLTIAVLVFDAPAILLWQVGLLFSLLPAHNIGTPEQPFYDYLLDGHHKMFAASETDQPITLLSFLSVKESVATEENVSELIEQL